MGECRVGVNDTQPMTFPVVSKMMNISSQMKVEFSKTREVELQTQTDGEQMAPAESEIREMLLIKIP